MSPWTLYLQEYLMRKKFYIYMGEMYSPPNNAGVCYPISFNIVSKIKAPAARGCFKNIKRKIDFECLTPYFLLYMWNNRSNLKFVI